MEDFDTNPHTPTIPAPPLTEPHHPPVTPDSIAQDVINLAAELVAAVATRKNVEAERKVALSEFDGLVAQWKARLEPVKDLEETLRSEILAVVESIEEVQRRMLEMCVTDPSLASKIPNVPKLEGVSFAWRSDVEIVDPDAVPREWCVPDAARIKKAVMAGIPIPGCEAVQKRSVTVR